MKLQFDKKERAYYYEILQNAKEKDEKLQIKIEKFLKLIQSFRDKKEYLPLDELIWQIYLDTGYYNYVSLMPNGLLRQANLKMLFEKAKEYENASFKGLFNFINFIDKLKLNNQDIDSAKTIGENEDVVRIMSIHKSKGLEFPVVFLCSTKKRFNLQDLNDNILVHQDIGFGPQYIDYERKIQYSTLAKVAIGYKSKVETISEEMRILYVALTRAKEKLIITGIEKDLEKSIKKKQEMLEMYKTSTISTNILKNCKSYLDWIELVYLNNKDTIQDIIELNTYTKEELIKKLKTEKENKKNVLTMKEKVEQELKEKHIDKNKENELEEILNWKYKNINCVNKSAKTSVTKMKEMQNENIPVLFEDDEVIIKKQEERAAEQKLEDREEQEGRVAEQELGDREEQEERVAEQELENVQEQEVKNGRIKRDGIQENGKKEIEQSQYKVENLMKPKFLKENLQLTKAEIGTLMHLCIQKIDEKQEYTKEKVENEIQKLVQNEIITRI